MSNTDNLDRKKRHKAVQEANRIPKLKRKKAKNARKREKKLTKRKAAGLCEHCGRKPEECTKLAPVAA